MPTAPIPWKRQKEIMAGYEGEWKGRKLCLLLAHPFGIRDGMSQGSWGCRGKARYSFVKKVKILKLHKGVLVCQTYVTPYLMKSWSVSFGDFHPSGRIGKQL